MCESRGRVGTAVEVAAAPRGDGDPSTSWIEHDEHGVPFCPDWDLPLVDDDTAARLDALDQQFLDDTLTADPVTLLDPRDMPATAAAEVIALGETALVTPALIAQLWAIDPNELCEDQAVGYTVAMQRISNATAGRVAVGATRVVDASPNDPRVPRELHAAGQLGPALGLGSGGADTLVSAAPQIIEVLPQTRAMLLAGDLSWRKATSIAISTIGLPPDKAALVEDKVLAKSWTRSPARHDAAVRRAVEQVDPGNADRKRRERERDIRMVTHHYGAGMGQVFIDAPSEWVDLIRTAADTYARRLKAAGDPRPLDQLRVAALVNWASSFLTHGDPSYCDTTCQPLPPDPDADPDWPRDSDLPPDDGPTGDGPEPDSPAGDGAAAAAAGSAGVGGPPARHGRPVVVRVVWDLTSLLGLTDHCGLLVDTDTPLPPEAIRELLTGGLRLRRMLINPHTGELLDLTPVGWTLPARNRRAHGQPVELRLTVNHPPDNLPADVRAALEQLDRDNPALAAILRELLAHPVTAADLDNRPHTDTPSPALAEHVTSRDGHPINPTAGPSPATAGDIDHQQARSHGGTTVTRNLGSLTRRWHRLKTHGHWTVAPTQPTQPTQATHTGWTWTSPTGRTYTTHPYDYRLGP